MAENLLVPISSEHVQVGLRWREMTVSQLVDVTKESQQTIDAIVRGVTSRCREERRDLLAEALDVPSVWLSGEMRLANVRPWGPTTVDLETQTEARFWMAPHLAPDRIVLSDPQSAYDLASWDTSRRVIRAWSRDVERGHERAVRAYEAVSTPEGPKWLLVRKAVERALSARGWRHFFFGLQPNKPEFGPIDFDELAETATEVAIAEGKALNRILEPWYSDALEMNYEVLADAVAWLASGMFTPVRRKRLIEALGEPSTRASGGEAPAASETEGVPTEVDPGVPR